MHQPGIAKNDVVHSFLSPALDRGAVIAWCAMLEAALGHAIGTRRRPPPKLPGRIDVAYELGIVDFAQRDQLKKIKTLRDRFTQNLQHLTFDSDDLAGLIRSLRRCADDSNRAVIERSVRELFEHLQDRCTLPRNSFRDASWEPSR